MSRSSDIGSPLVRNDEIVSDKTRNQQQLPVVTQPNCYLSNTAIGVAILNTPTCPPGFFCPNSTAGSPQTYPQVCPPTDQCQLMRLAGKSCPPQGRYEPIVCRPGSYCPSSTRMLSCPPGSFCPTGSFEANRCSWMSHCPGGAAQQVFYGGIFLCLLIDFMLLAMKVWERLKYRSRLRSSYGSVNSNSSASLSSLFALNNSQEFQQSDENGDRKASYDEEKLAVVYEVFDRIDRRSIVTVKTIRFADGADPALLDGYMKAFGFADSISFRKHCAIDLQFRDLSLTLPDGRCILRSVSGHIRPGRLTCIMGPSGAGKTTFMNVLMGKVRRSRGELWINGKPGELRKFKDLIGFVPQEDVMLRELTVREIIRYSASIRLPRSWSEEEVERFVDAVVGNLGLSHVQHQVIGDEITRGLSGGQRKRVNIGMELATAPLLLFCDEPTSGLDSTAALKVASTLKSIAALGVTVVTVLHQPRFEIFDQFDDVVLLAPGGLTAYVGEQELVVEYFEQIGYYFDPQLNPADVLMDILSGKGSSTLQHLTSQEFAELWQENQATFDRGLSLKPQQQPERRRSSLSTLLQTPPFTTQESSLQRQTASWFRQTLLAHNRSLTQQYRHFNSFLIEMLVSALAGGLMGIAVMGVDAELYRGIYRKPFSLISPSPLGWVLPLVGMLIAMAVGLAGAPAAVRIFGEERPVYWRESAANHNRSAYYVGKSISVIYRMLITALHFTSIFYVLAKPVAAFDKVYGIVTVLFYCVYGLSTIISMCVRRENASLVAVVACLFAGTFCGFGPTLVDAKRWHLDWFWELSYAKHCTEALYNLEVGSYANVYDLEETSKFYGYAIGDVLAKNVCLALLIGTILRLVSFMMMIFLNRDKQR